tara:strand:- start:231 stop:467 length:237 start_codon:yes stop_codon:yes gene_type:complete
MASKKLTKKQTEQLVEQFAEIIVENMDVKTLVQIVYDNLIDDFDQLSEVELKEEVVRFDEELYDELVNNVLTESSEAN